MLPTNLIQYLEKSPVTITTEKEATNATTTLSVLNKHLGAIIAKKEEKTKPLNEALKKIRLDYKPYEDQLQERIDFIRQSLSAYATKQREEAKLLEEHILADKRTTSDTKVQKLAEIASPLSKLKTDQGTVSFVTVRKYRIIDQDAIPRAFLHVNEEAIRQAMKEDQPIPGVEYYEEQSIRNYRK